MSLRSATKSSADRDSAAGPGCRFVLGLSAGGEGSDLDPQRAGVAASGRAGASLRPPGGTEQRTGTDGPRSARVAQRQRTDPRYLQPGKAYQYAFVERKNPGENAWCW